MTISSPGLDPVQQLTQPILGFERADFFVLAPDPAHPGRKAYRPVPIGDDGVYHSTILPGLWLQVAWLWQEDAVPLKCIAAVVGRERLLALLD